MVGAPYNKKILSVVPYNNQEGNSAPPDPEAPNKVLSLVPYNLYLNSYNFIDFYNKLRS